MNWSQLKEKIEEMTPQQLLQKVRFIEPYDKQRAGYFLKVAYAKRDLMVEGDPETGDEGEVVFVKTGEPFLV
jgi:hypothetical protein